MADTNGHGWGRKEFNVRLSKRRREQLAAWASASDSPTAALDKALAAAGAPRAPSPTDCQAVSNRLDEIEEALEAHAGERRAEAAGLASEMRGLRDALEILRRSLEELARDELEDF